jgi:hypothetical protein
MIDPNNFNRVVLAIERWIKTGDVLVACLERAGDSANAQRVQTLKTHVQKLQETITQLRG